MVNARPRPGAAATSGAVTLSRVAELAGVSSATASRVLHGSGGRAVREDLRSRVLAAAEDLRYVSNGPAQALARASSSVVGLVVHDVADPYFSAIAAGAMRVARAHDLMVMLAATFRDPDLELEYLARLRAQRARAVLLAGSGFTDPAFTARLAAQIEDFGRQGGRVALVGQHGVSADAVLPAHGEGAAEAAGYLWGLGHRRIAVVCGPRILETVADRLAGVRQALGALGGELAESDIAEGDFTRDGGRTAALELFGRSPDVTAVLALNDLMAAGVLAALREDLRRRVPDEVSVIGFDDLPQAADLHPALTTVRLPLEEIGERALRLILEEQPGREPRRVPVPATLVVRASTGPARR